MSLAGDLLDRHLNLYRGVDPAVAEAIYDPNVTFEFVYAPQHHTQRIEGRDKVAAWLGRIGEFFAPGEVGVDTVYELTEPDRYVVEYHATATSKETGKPYAQNYIAIVTLREGKIAHVKEYYNPVRVLVATGEMEEPGS
jgi:hypothetical protein